VPNWSISRNYKENRNSTKISVTPGMHLPRGGSVQRLLTSGPKGWPAGPTLQPLVGWLHGHTLQEVVTRNPKLEVSGRRTRRPPDHMTGLASQHLACYQHNQVSNSSLDPYKYPPSVEFKTPHSTCKCSSLVVVVQAKPCRKSRVESSLRSSSGSSLGDR
jgi:hypothetical protein